MIEAILTCFVLVMVFMALVFVLAQIVEDNSIIDIAWGLGFVLVAWFSFFHFATIHKRKLVLLILISMWGIRLAVYIFLRRKGKSEDFRYRAFRTKWKKYFFLKMFFKIFMFQGFLLTVISIPIIVVSKSAPSSPGIFDYLGLSLFLTGFLFEIIADFQKSAFKRKSENRDRLMTQGLWKFSRHPNYFGESLLWWGIWVLSLSVPTGWIGVISPALLTFLLVFVSGIPMLEKSYSGRPGFSEYKSKTSVFIPWFPKV
jgi:steroid 5-alpha reductase family enzyme